MLSEPVIYFLGEQQHFPDFKNKVFNSIKFLFQKIIILHTEPKVFDPLLTVNVESDLLEGRDIMVINHDPADPVVKVLRVIRILT